MNIWSIFRSTVTQGPEITRVFGGLGVVIYLVAVHAFVAYEVFWLKKPFDLTAYCTVFPAGFAIILGTTSVAAGTKDRNVAAANMTQAGG